MDNLKFRRQYIIMENAGSVKLPVSWKYSNFAQLHIYTHPDLEITIVSSKDSSITVALLGFIIDPHNPANKNGDILHKLLETDMTLNSISDFLYYVAGRFVLIISAKDDIFVFNDPCGLRSVYYTKYNGGVIIASNPSIFKDCIKNDNRYLMYQNSEYVKSNVEHWIPSGCSLFEDVFHLVPNHMLQVSNLKQVRYYPMRPLVHANDNSSMEIQEAINKTSKLLSQSLKAASNRYRLALPLTAGYDSRVLLSAAKGIAEDVFFYTLKYRDLNEKSLDIFIPRKLMEKLKLSYNIINCSPPPPPPPRISKYI